MTPIDPWHDRWRRAVREAGYSSAEKLALEVQARGFPLHRLTATAWESGKFAPSPAYRLVLVEVSPLFAPLIAELPARTSSRADLQRRVDILEARLEEVETAAADAAERLESRLLELDGRLPRAGDPGQS